MDIQIETRLSGISQCFQNHSSCSRSQDISISYVAVGVLNPVDPKTEHLGTKNDFLKKLLSLPNLHEVLINF